MNLSGFVDEDNTTFQPFDVNVTTDQPQYDYNDDDDDGFSTPYAVMIVYVCPALGIPGNIFSAIIWLKRQVASKNNSSAVYLAVLAINDLVFVISFLSFFLLHEYNIILYIFALVQVTNMLEPLLVLGFSVERLIAISCPLQVSLCNYV